jgi:hypothetical protein
MFNHRPHRDAAEMHLSVAAARSWPLKLAAPRAGLGDEPRNCQHSSSRAQGSLAADAADA